MGLRNLYVAKAEIPQATFDEWQQAMEKAKALIEGREEAFAEAHKIVECELDFIGSTAIEDKLQDEVAETINFLKMAGIKVWVLTGDKVDTAINIGKSAGLIDAETQYEIGEEF